MGYVFTVMDYQLKSGVFKLTGFGIQLTKFIIRTIIGIIATIKF